MFILEKRFIENFFFRPPCGVTPYKHLVSPVLGWETRHRFRRASVKLRLNHHSQPILPEIASAVEKHEITEWRVELRAGWVAGPGASCCPACRSSPRRRCHCGGRYLVPLGQLETPPLHRPSWDSLRSMVLRGVLPKASRQSHARITVTLG